MFHEFRPSGRARWPLASLHPRFLRDVGSLHFRRKLVGRLASGHLAVPVQVAKRNFENLGAILFHAPIIA